MWLSTNTKFNDSLMFFQFRKESEFLICRFTNLKQYFSKKIHESSFASEIVSELLQN